MMRRVLWFVGLWAAGVLAVGVVALLIRWLLRPAAAASVLLAGAAQAAAMDCGDAVAVLRPDLEDTPGLVRTQPSRCALVPWTGGLSAVAVARDETVLVGLIRGAPDFAATEAVGEVEALSIDPLWSPSVEIVPVPLIGRGGDTIGVRLSNAYVSTGRSTATEALHVLLRREDTLVPVLAVLLRAEHSAERPCPRGRRPPCRTAWSRQWVLDAAGPAPPRAGGRPPDLVVRDARNGAIVSRHRWTREGYRPAVFDRTPPLGPG
jgi:hypothetical protein